MASEHSFYDLADASDRLGGILNHPLIRILRRIMPVSLQRWMWAVLRLRPPIGRVRFGQLRRLTPISRDYGFDRGLPIDRYYIEGFLSDNSDDIRGHVLEVGDPRYTQMFGGENVSQSDVLHVKEGTPTATIIADLSDADHIPSNSFDCIILVQTLQFIYDSKAAVHTANRILKPGGVLLATIPGISQADKGQWSSSLYWSFTKPSATRLFGEVFPPPQLVIQVYGNVLSASSFLYGLSCAELQKKELDFCDKQYPVIITIRAQKPRVHESDI